MTEPFSSSEEEQVVAAQINWNSPREAVAAIKNMSKQAIEDALVKAPKPACDNREIMRAVLAIVPTALVFCSTLRSDPEMVLIALANCKNQKEIREVMESVELSPTQWAQLAENNRRMASVGVGGFH